MTQTWSCMEHPTQNTVISFVMIMKEKCRGHLRPGLGLHYAQTSPSHHSLLALAPRKAPHTHKKFSPGSFRVPKSPLVVMSFLCPEVHLDSGLLMTRPWVDC